MYEKSKLIRQKIASIENPALRLIAELALESRDVSFRNGQGIEKELIVDNEKLS